MKVVGVLGNSNMIVPTDFRFRSQVTECTRGDSRITFLRNHPECNLSNVVVQLSVSGPEHLISEVNQSVIPPASKSCGDVLPAFASTTLSSRCDSRPIDLDGNPGVMSPSEVCYKNTPLACDVEFNGQIDRTTEDTGGRHMTSVESRNAPSFSSSETTISHPHRSQTPHFCLRNALLYTGRATSHPALQPTSDDISNGNRLNDSNSLSKPCDDSAISYKAGCINGSMSKEASLSCLTVLNNPVCPTDASANSSSLKLSSSSVTRPPSASNIYGRASYDDFTGSLTSQVKSISQPQSPDSLPRNSTLPPSPCRLPMKKRKVDWNQLCDLSVCSNPLTITSAAQSVNQTSSTLKRASKPRQCPSVNGQNPLVIDRPLNSIADSSACDKKYSLDTPTSLNSLATCCSVDCRPRSIPAYLTSFEVRETVGVNNTGHPISARCSNVDLPTSCLPTSSGQLKAVNSKETLSSKLSLLARTLTSMSDLSRPSVQQVHANPTVAQDSLNSRPYHFNASNPCVHPPEESNAVLLNGSDGRFSAKVLSTCIQPVPCTRTPPSMAEPDDRCFTATCTSTHCPVLAQFVSAKPAKTVLTTVSAMNEDCDSGLRMAKINVPIEQVSGNNDQISTAAAPSPLDLYASPANAPQPSDSSDPSYKSDEPVKHSAGSDVLDCAQVLMMLSPTCKEPHVENSSMTMNNSRLVQNSYLSNSPRKTGVSSPFPLLLISASSSAGAAALAAAAAVATGAPPSSLVPVPVQLTAYVPPLSDRLKSPSLCDSSNNGSDTDTFNRPRFMISLCTSPVEDRNVPKDTKISRLASVSDKFKKNTTAPSDFHLSVPTNPIPISHNAAMAHSNA